MQDHRQPGRAGYGQLPFEPRHLGGAVQVRHEMIQPHLTNGDRSSLGDTSLQGLEIARAVLVQIDRMQAQGGK